MSATSAVLAITELLEMILAPGSLAILDLLHCRQVCHEWHQTIDNSLRLQKRMHLIPESAPAGREPRVVDTLPPYATAILFKQCAAPDDPAATDDDNYWYPDDDEEPHTKAGDRPFRVELDVPYHDIHSQNSDPLKTILLIQPPHQISSFRVAARRRGVEDFEQCLGFRPLYRNMDETATVGASVEAAKFYQRCYPRGSRGGRGLEGIRVTAFVRPAGADHEVFDGAAKVD